MKKKNVKIFFIILFLSIITFKYCSLNKKDKIIEIPIETDKAPYNSNIIENVNYSSKDAKGNEYIIDAAKGEIDYSNNNVIYLTDVKALIKLKNSNNIYITSDYGRYNTNNFDTIFSKNVIINYLQNEIKGEYLDFSIQRNSMIISKNVIYKNKDNILKTDVIEVNIKTRDTKLFMYDKENKVSLLNQN